MAKDPVRPVGPPRPAELSLLKDPQHPALFVVDHMGSLTLLLVVVLCSAMALAGSLVHLRVRVADGEGGVMKSVSLGRYVADQLGLWPLSERDDGLP